MNLSMVQIVLAWILCVFAGKSSLCVCVQFVRVCSICVCEFESLDISTISVTFSELAAAAQREKNVSIKFS